MNHLFNDIPESFSWFNHHHHDDFTTATRSISDGSIEIQDGEETPRRPTSSIACSSALMFDDDWITQGFLNDTTYPDHILQEAACPNSITNYSCPQMDPDFPLEQQAYAPDFLTFTNMKSDNASPLNLASDDFHSSMLIQTLFEVADFQALQSLSTDGATNRLSSSPNYQKDSSAEEALPLSKQQPARNGLQFNVDTTLVPVWNSMAAPSIQSRILPFNFIDNVKANHLSPKHCEEIHKLPSESENHIHEAAIKRPRIEIPSPLPITFKVRKEKLGDRITALQQLVSPFGKTDTASVLHEAIEYIKFLHDQVSVCSLKALLSAPYVKDGSPLLRHQQKDDEVEGLVGDLKGRGLCLVPVSTTFPVAAETSCTATHFITPIFGGSFR